jgi:predicted AlkP superfamily pyrophosphatase or phosphodiesterase
MRLIPALILCLAFALLAPGTTFAQKANDRHVVVICVDGLPAYLFDDANASMPAIRGLAASGVRAKGMTVSNPSVTWPNHTTLTTGVRPEKHGVLFNGMLERTGPGLPVKVDGRKDKSQLVRVRTIYDVVHDKGMRTAAINWPCTRNAASVDDNFPDVPDAIDYTTPRLIAELKQAAVVTDADVRGFSKLGTPARDWIWTQAACQVIRARKPNLLLFHPLNVDAVHHRYGPQTPAGYTAVAYADTLVRDVVEAVDAAGIRDRTTFFVVSDHGFMAIPKSLQPNVVLRQEGLLTVENGQVAAARVQVIPEGGIGMLYLTIPEKREEQRKKLSELFRDREGIDAVVGPEDFGKHGLPLPDVYPQMADLILVAKDGYGFSATATGEDFVVASETTLGTHGFLSTNPKMNATFIASGAGIRKGEVIDVIENIDLAVTIARLLDVPFTGDGKVTAAALQD